MTATSRPTTTSTPVPLEPPVVSAEPTISPIGDDQWNRMVEAGVWRPECAVGRDDLRRLDVNFVDFSGDVQRGALVANRDAIDDLAAIFTELFDARFPIERMRPVERYGGDVNTSLSANNTSAFNCRRPAQANAPADTSPHANGRAIDINPWQNPWQDPRCRCWNPSDEFAAERTGRGVITEASRPWESFTERGWIWQDIKVADYMHFDTGYPSRPR